MPWEIVIKRFRTHLGREKAQTLEGYANRFFEFIRADTKLFPQDFRDQAFQSLLQRALLQTVSEVKSAHPEIFDTAKPDAERQALWNGYLAKKQADFAPGSLPPGFADQDVQEARVNALPNSFPLIDGLLAALSLQAVVPRVDIAELALVRSFKDFESLAEGDYTGIVFTGYGEDDFFPAFREYSCFGFLLSKLAVFPRKQEQITLQSTSMIEAFATTSMVDQFIRGMNFDLWRATLRHFRLQAEALVGEVFTHLNIPPVDVAALVQARLDTFRKEWSNEVYKDHWKPLSDVISTLAIEEMTELAETLVSLESLKERVTSPDQSVGGPVDVAVITKAEGFVWIKRKLFFDGRLNDRYFLRLREKFTGQAEA